MKKRIAIFIFLGALVSLGCGDANQDACMKGNLQACNAACDAGKAAACAKQAQLASERCIRKGDLKVCAGMCLMAKTGKELYCKKQKELCAQPANKSLEQCASVQ